MKPPSLDLEESTVTPPSEVLRAINAAAQGRRPVRLGIVGGGQLARMTALAAAPLGVEVAVLEREPDSPAAVLAPASVVGDWNRLEALLDFAGRCDVITLENQFVDAAALEELERRGHPVFPRPACLAVTQDKLRQKEALTGAGLPVASFRSVTTREDLVIAGRDLGWPLVLKTRRNGYDGKGNFTLRSESEIEIGVQALHGDRNPLLVEAFFPFVQELAVIITRGRDGTVAVYPVVETVQRNHICHVVKAPAALPEATSARAAWVAQAAVEAVGGVGSWGVEMFLAADGQLAVNELAPRVHNSGHYTIEACECSQFENHVRAVLGWPLGSPRLVAPAAAMVNLLGTTRGPGRAEGLPEALSVPGARVHLYGKSASAPGRKMGHVTVLAGTADEALAIAGRAARSIRFGGV